MASSYGTSDGAVTINIDAISGGQRNIRSLHWGYDADPSGGAIEVQSPVGTTIFKQPVTKGGAGYTHWVTGLRGAASGAVRVILADPGGTINAYLNVEYD